MSIGDGRKGRVQYLLWHPGDNWKQSLEKEIVERHLQNRWSRNLNILLSDTSRDAFVKQDLQGDVGPLCAGVGRAWLKILRI